LITFDKLIICRWIRTLLGSKIGCHFPGSRRRRTARIAVSLRCNRKPALQLCKVQHPSKNQNGAFFLLKIGIFFTEIPIFSTKFSIYLILFGKKLVREHLQEDHRYLQTQQKQLSKN
jgi:hypothetical protein